MCTYSNCIWEEASNQFSDWLDIGGGFWSPLANSVAIREIITVGFGTAKAVEPLGVRFWMRLEEVAEGINNRTDPLKDFWKTSTSPPRSTENFIGCYFAGIWKSKRALQFLMNILFECDCVGLCL